MGNVCICAYCGSTDLIHKAELAGRTPALFRQFKSRCFIHKQALSQALFLITLQIGWSANSRLVRPLR